MLIEKLWIVAVQFAPNSKRAGSTIVGDVRGTIGRQVEARTDRGFKYLLMSALSRA
jgi:hypothetical protein